MSDEPAIFQSESTFTIYVSVESTVGEPVDISAATRKDLVWKSPNGQINRQAMSFVGTGADGELYYQFTKDQSEQTGQYEFQVDLKFGTWDGPTEAGAFTVRRNLF